MLLLDGSFIIEHLYNFACGINEDELYQTRWAPAQLRIDLGLLENQIPYFILEALFEHLMPQAIKPDQPEQETPSELLQKMAMWYFLCGWYALSGDEREQLPVLPPGKPIHHLLHLLHMSHCAMIEKKPRQPTGWCGDGLRKWVDELCIQCMKLLFTSCGGNGHGHENTDMKENIVSALELTRRGVRFRKAPWRRGGLLDVRLSDDGTLEIPPLCIERVNAPLLHNLIALEQQKAPPMEDMSEHSTEEADSSWEDDTDVPQDYFSVYAFLMYNLVNTREDIALLQKHGILQNNYGPDDQVITYFKNICLWNQRSPNGHLKKILKRLRKRSEGREYREWGKIKKYCDSPLAVFLLILSAIVFASTISQAVSGLRVK